jgi:hypothetical protein
VKLTIANQAEIKPVNLGGDDSLDIVVNAEPPLPASVTPDQISLNSPTRPRRTNDNLATVYLDRPTFTEPQISNHGGAITFTACIADTSVDAGTYTGQVIVGGPEGVQASGVTITVNDKNATMFWVGFALALLIGALLSCLRAAKAEKDKQRGEVRGPWKAAFKAALRDRWLIVSTVFALAAAAAGMLKIYLDDPAWGADWIGGVIALFGTMLSVTGLSTFASSFKRADSGSAPAPAGAGDTPAPAPGGPPPARGP